MTFNAGKIDIYILGEDTIHSYNIHGNKYYGTEIYPEMKFHLKLHNSYFLR